MNGTKASITDLAKILSTGPLDPNVEVSARLLCHRGHEIIDFFFRLGRRWMSFSFHLIRTRITSCINWHCGTGKIS